MDEVVETMRENDEHQGLVATALKEALDAYLDAFGTSGHDKRKGELAELLWDNKVTIVHALNGIR